MRSLVIGMLCAAAVAVVPGCMTGDEGHAVEAVKEIDSAASWRIPRYVRMRDAARARGVGANAYLLAGIAYAESGVGHCWSEATHTCKGPNSPDCGGGPVLAGAADGPCENQQGGIGMFQFDAGTYAQTLAQYGHGILGIEGQMASALDFVIDMVRRSTYTTGAETLDKAKDWINRFDLDNAQLRDQWIKTVVRFYNGCAPTRPCWEPRLRSYSQALDKVLVETSGRAFWAGTATEAISDSSGSP